MTTRQDPGDFLPLTHLGFHVLIAVADRPMHGYAIVKDVRERSGGRVDPGTGSFYSVVHGLAEQGLIQGTATPPAADDRRRYYAITELGRAVLAAEVVRLKNLVRDAERRRPRAASSRAGSR